MGKKPKSISPSPPWPHLLPFLLSVALSLAVFAPAEAPSTQGLLIKCLPILLLITYVRHHKADDEELNRVYRALQFSVVGDALLVWPDQYFLHGVAFFGIAQVLYTAAFGFSAVSVLWGAVPLYALSIAIMVVVLPGLPTPLRVGLPIYAFLLATMLWRALDRARLREDLSGARRWCSLAGAASFMASDLCIATLQLSQLIPHAAAQRIILSTYYLAQLLLVLGSLEAFWAPRPKSKEQ